VRIQVSSVRLKDRSDPKAKSRAKDAENRKKQVDETLEDAWARIMQTKAYQTKKAKFDEVRRAMFAGEIGREPGSEGKKLSAAECDRLYKKLQERKREQVLRDLVENTPVNYSLIMCDDDLDKLVDRLKLEKTIAVDTETTGVDVYTDVIVGISFTLPTYSFVPSAELGWHVYIPFEHTKGPAFSKIEWRNMDRGRTLDRLKEVLYDESIGKVLHNAIFDIAMFRRHGYDLLGVVWDTQTAMHLLNENEPSFKLKDLAPKYLKVEASTFEELFGKDAQFKDVPIDIALVYAAKDTHLTWRLYEFQLKHMSKMPTILKYYTEIEVPLLYVIVDLEANGYILDLDYAREYGEELHRRANELEKWLIEILTPHHDGEGSINLNSPAQMRPAMSKAIGKELPNMDAKKTLKPLAKTNEIVAKYLEYKNVTKLSSTYIDTLPTKQNPTTKRWHSRFNPMGTVTGRFSSGKDKEYENEQQFNVQNQPNEARPMFLAPPGKVLISADFKAQEVRCAAYLSGEPVLIDAFLTNRDPYAMMASEFYGKPYEECYKNPDGSDTPERKEFKVVWLALLYGMSNYTLAENLGISVKEAEAFREKIFGTMPVLAEWIRGNEEFAKKHGFVWADKQQRKRRLPEAKNPRKFIPYGKWKDPKYEQARKHNAAINRAMRQATNSRVQGSSSIQTKKTMIKAWEYCKQRDGWELWATVHDELIFEIPEGFTREDAEAIRDIMINSYKWGDVVPNGTDLEVMYRWGQGVTVEDWFRGIRPEK
jgi:DNA polymerase I